MQIWTEAPATATDPTAAAGALAWFELMCILLLFLPRNKREVLTKLGYHLAQHPS